MAAVHGYNTPGDMRVFLKSKDRVNVKEKKHGCTVMDFLYNNKEFSIFVYLVERANLVSYLEDEMFGCTVFVPTNTALLQKYDENVFKNISQEKAFDIVKYSILLGKIEYWLLKTIGRAALFPKSSYDRIDLRVENNTIVLNKKVRVYETDKVCSNGAILFIDDLLIPYNRN